VLQSLEMPAVTQGRGSPDYNVKSEQWRIGDNALFLDAIALRPTKDCFRSNVSSGEMFPRLQAAVSALSGGPVFPCDEVGTSDVALIMRTCNAAGELLQPTRAAAPIDASILAKSGVRQPAGMANASGELWRADTWLDAGGLHFPQLLAADSGAYTLHMAELLDPGEVAPAAGFVATEAAAAAAPTARQARALTATQPLVLPRTDKASFQLWSFSPRLAGGWALLGEVHTKWVPVSTTRFSDVAEVSQDG
jgi:hypothetical protein